MHVGFDVNFSANRLFTADLRRIGVETDAKVDGAKVDTVKIDPLVYGLAIGYRF